MNLLPELDLFTGPITASQAKVYVRIAHIDNRAGRYRLAGQLHGPFCRGAHTLPAKLTLVDQGRGPTVLATATVPDPCAWTSDLPSLYRFQIELHLDDSLISTCEVTSGLRRMGVAGRSFVMDGQRWVARGAISPHSYPADEWRENRMVQIVGEADERQCGNSVEQGNKLMIVTDQLPPIATIRRYVRTPSIMALVLPAPILATCDRRTIPTLILGATISNEDEIRPEALPAASFDFLYGSPADLRRLWNDYPCVAVDSAINMTSSLADIRRLCELLQAKLAPASLAGYIVKCRPPLADSERDLPR